MTNNVPVFYIFDVSSNVG